MNAHRLAGISSLRLVVVLIATVVPAGHAAAAERPGPSSPWCVGPHSFVVLREDIPGSWSEFIDEVERAGSHVAVVYPPNAAVVVGDPTTLASPALGRLIRRVDRGRLSTAEIASLAPAPQRAARFWNASLRFDSLASTMPSTGGGRDRVLPRLDRSLLAPSVTSDAPRARPYGAYDLDQSEYMAGTVSTGIWLLESPDHVNDWTSAEEAETIGGIQAGMEGWVRHGGPPARLTFVFDIHTAVPVSGDPITECDATDKWIREALESAGYTGYASGFPALVDYNNDARTLHDTDWAFSIFVADTPVDYGGFCATMGTYAWAALGGPYVFMYRFSSWAYNSGRYAAAVPMHEVGHIFYATDEYNSTVTYSGYLNAPDLPFPVCVMNANDTSAVCSGTGGQIGWAYLNGNGVVDPLDALPSMTAALIGDNPSTTPSIAYSGSATVGLVPNLNPFSNYATRHDISVDHIAGVEARVDGGPWEASTPADGTYDGYSEDFTWNSQPLPDGLHVIEFRAPTEFGAGRDPSFRDSLWVLATSSDHHPLVQAPASINGYEQIELAFVVNVWDPDGDAIDSLTADLSGMPGGASFDVVPDQTSGLFRWAPQSGEAGDYSVTFHAFNALSHSAVTAIHVVHVDRLPEVQAPAVVAAVEGRYLGFDASASDPDGDPITSFTAGVQGLPAGNDAGFTWNGGAAGTFHWTPSCVDAGSYSVTFFARNNFQGSAYAEGLAAATIQVANDCSAWITPIDDIDMQAGTSDSVEVYILDLNGGEIGVVADLPPFAALQTKYNDPGEYGGRIHLNAAVADTGDYSAGLVATVDGVSDVERFEIRVTPTTPTAADDLLWDGVSVEATPERVILRWRLPDLSVTALSVERSTDGSAWTTRMADLTAADGAFVLEDDDVAGGARYAYRFSRGSSRDRVYSPILWVDVPASETVPATPRIARIAPSPTSGSATIRFAVPAGGRLSLAVIDVRGRLVRRLEGGEVPRGWHSIEWDGNSGAGSAAPSGIYFVRLDAMGAHAMERIVLVR